MLCFGTLTERRFSVWDFSILLSIKLLLRTIPFLILKAVVLLIFTLVLTLGPLAGIVALGYLTEAQILPKTQPSLVVGALIGLLLALWAISWLRSWALYLVKAAHIAVLVELVQGRPLPDGRGQISYGQSVVKERFGEASVLFVLDEVIRAALRAIDRITFGFLSFLPRKTGVQIATVLRTFLYFAFSYLDELVLAHAIDKRSDDPWGSARDALVLYGQNWSTILKNALWLTLFTLVPLGLIFSFMVWPAWSEYQVAHTPEALRAVVPGALIFAAVGSVLAGPFALVCLIQVWFRAISEDRLSPDWSAEISELAPQLDQFRGPRMSMRRAGGTTRNGDLV